MPIFLSLRPSRFWWGCGGSVCAFLCPGATIACARARADAATSPGRAALWLPRVVVCFVKGVVDEETPRNVREYAVPSFHPKSRKLGGREKTTEKSFLEFSFLFSTSVFHHSSTRSTPEARPGAHASVCTPHPHPPDVGCSPATMPSSTDVPDGKVASAGAGAGVVAGREPASAAASVSRLKAGTDNAKGAASSRVNPKP